MSFFDKVYEIVKKIPYGKVATYGQIASMCGSPRSARQVGWALHVNPNPYVIPCHRVVNRFGFLSGGFAFGGIDAQKSLLCDEGIYVSDEYNVNLKEYLWEIEN